MVRACAKVADMVQSMSQQAHYIKSQWKVTQEHSHKYTITQLIIAKQHLQLQKESWFYVWSDSPDQKMTRPQSD